jgi:methyl-accepting chemotaxis protein
VSDDANSSRASALSRRRSRTLYQITLLVVAVFIVSGLVTYFVYNRSQNRLLNKSKAKLLQMEVNSVYSLASYSIDFLIYLGQDKLKELDPQSLLAAAGEGRLTPGQEYLNRMLKAMVDSGFMGLKAAVVIIPPSETIPVEQIIAASNPDLVYKRGVVPDDLTRAISDGKRYMWAKDGVPALGTHANSLVVTKEADLNGAGFKVGLVTVKPMDGDIAAINRFIDPKKSEGSRNLALLTVISVVVMSLLTFGFLAYLIRKRITKPIDELSALSREVLDGNLDVEIPMRKGEEFAGLKLAFKTMVKNFKVMISLPHGGEHASGIEELVEEEKSGAPAGGRKAGKGYASKRSRTPYYITAFLVVIFLISGAVNFLVFNYWQNSLIDTSVDKMVKQISGQFTGLSVFVRDTLDPLVTERLDENAIPDLTIEEQADFILSKKAYAYQAFYNQFSKEIVDRGLMGLEKVMGILAGFGISDGAMVIVSNDQNLIYDWTVPDYLVKAMKDGTPYLYFENGIPELKLKGEQIFTIKTFRTMGFYHSYIGVVSVHKEIVEMKSFYNREKRDLYLTLIPVVVGTLIVLVLLTFLALSFLIRRQITRPANELSAAAEQIMGGSLDVEIPVREGEELESLKHLFREMMESFRVLITKATSGE